MLRQFKDSTKRYFLERGYQVDRLHPVLLFHVLAKRLGYGVYKLSPEFPLHPPINPQDLRVLSDPEFQRSIQMVEKNTLLDVARLANLWSLARMTGAGAMLEIGSFRGGGALHIANACPDKEMFVFDSFEGFRNLAEGLDDIFGKDWFKDASDDYVRELFRRNNRKATVTKGFFPDSAAGMSLGPIAFCHLDVDVYEATRDSLEYLKTRLAPRSLIVLDDYNRGAHGMDRALTEFVQRNSGFAFFPMFPGQALLVPLDLWKGGGR